ncbi:putative disease resistance protein At4g19050 [Solanum verrucosum]|uniref:putative disease resistance protein At4g19050 n=1 Tax=Solanum verrucosum TaxID=315347 RepID=UPI0020D1B355|nr:putative disease resistance protein At4g19050 [Solanum verrucosum]
MASASFRTKNASNLEQLYTELKAEGKERIILTGKDDEIEKLTWIAKKSSGRAIVEEMFDFTILWELSFPNGDIDERLACNLSSLSPPDEWELENNKKDITKEEKETRTKKLLEDEMIKILESKKVVLIFVDGAGKMDELSMNMVSHRIKELKANHVREILVTTAHDKVENQLLKGVIKVEHDQINDNHESLSSWCKHIGNTIYKTLGLQSKLLLESILIDFYCPKNKFPFQSGRAHYSELITYWILEGFLGPFDCFENAYEKGHHVLMALAHHGFIEKLHAGYVRKSGKKLFLSTAYDCCRMEETVRLGLGNVFKGDLGRIAQADGIMRTFGKFEKEKKPSTLLIDRNFLNGEVSVDLFQSMGEIEALAIFNPTSKPEPILSLEMQNLRLLVLRGCTFLGGIENFLKLRSTEADNISFQKLSVLEISGPSPSLTIPDNLFERMPHIQSLNLSSLEVASLPSSLYHLTELVWLILRDCSSLKQIGSLKSMTKLQVLDLSGSTSLEKFLDKSFAPQNKSGVDLKRELQMLNLSNTKIKLLPVINELENLTYLLLRDCKSLSRLRMIGSLKKLKILDLSGAINFVEFHDQSLEQLGALEEINVSQTQIEKLPSDICNIRRLSLRGCSKFKEFPHLKNPDALQFLDLSATKLISVPSISNLSNLRELFLSCCCSLVNLGDLSSLKDLLVLDLSGCKALTKLAENSFENMHCLQNLNLSETSIEYLPSLSHLNNLRRLFLQKCTKLERFPSLESLTNLEELNLAGLKCLGEVDFLKNMVNLHLLNIAETGVKHLPSLSNLKKLKHLFLRGCLHLLNLEGVTTLEVLDLSGSHIVDLPSFEGFHNLRCLILRDCPNIKEFKDLEISEVLKAPIEKLPYSISKLNCLNHLELPKMKDGNRICHPEELLHRPWRISSWPLDKVPSSHMVGIFVDNFQVLQLLKNNPTIGKSFHFTVHPIEEKTDIGGKYFYQNELFHRDTFFRTIKLCQCEEGRKCQCRKLERSLEIRGFSDYPRGLERLASQAEFLFLIDNQFIKSLSSLGAESIRMTKFYWIEGCSEMESILSGDDNNQGSSKEISIEVEHRLEILRVSHAVCLKNICSSGSNLQSHALASLRCLYLEHCPELANCSPSYYLDHLQILQIKFCKKFRILFEDEKAQPLLKNLQKLCLWALPNLESVSGDVPLFQTLIVGECPKLGIVEKREILKMNEVSEKREIQKNLREIVAAAACQKK